MNRKLSYIVCAVSLFLHAMAHAGEKSSSKATDPVVYADISEESIESAVSFDGIRGLFGLGMGFCKYDSSITGGGNSTSSDLNVFGISAGMEYAKSFKNNFLIGATLTLDISKKKKKQSEWRNINAQYDSRVAGANKVGSLETDLMTPSIAMKCGYVLRSYKTLLFASIGVSKVGGSYIYYNNGAKTADFSVSAAVPNITVGAEHKLNKKLGIALQASIPVRRTAKKDAGNVEHKIKLGRTDIRLLGTYNMTK